MTCDVVDCDRPVGKYVNVSMVTNLDGFLPVDVNMTMGLCDHHVEMLAARTLARIKEAMPDGAVQMEG